MDNVIKLENRSTYDHIQAFLTDLETNNTRILYRRSIEKFVHWKYRDMKIEHLQPKHFNELTYLDMKKFRQYLRNKYSVATVNSKMYGIYALLKELKKIKVNGEYVYHYVIEDLKLKPLKNTSGEDYGDVEWEEVSEWINYIKNSNLNNKEAKAMFFHIARVTGLRKQAILKLTYKDLRQTPEGVWQLHSSLKGKKHSISIKEEDANKLLSLKQTDDKTEKIFKMSEKTIERLFSHIKEVFNIDPSRNIVLHSLRGLSGWEVYMASGKNILATQQHLNHSSIQTTYKYIHNREKSIEQPTLYMRGEINKDDISGLSKEQLLEVFDELSRSAKYEILNVAKDLNLLD